ncbi:MAG: glycosyltransferase family 2 protein [Patescibacteria group bacterium]|nr:glycosyltransferase family 2 protein [Patescibacteria group bacterium]
MRNGLGQRFLEMIPGFFIWATFAGAVALIFWNPRGMMILILLFDLYWLFRMYYMMLHVVSAWRQYRQCVRVNWISRLERSYPSAWHDYWHLIILPTYGEPYAVIQRSLRSLVDSHYAHDRMLVVLAGEARDAARFARIARQAETEFGQKFARFQVTVHPDGLPGELPGKGSNLNYAGRQAQAMVDALGIPYAQVIVSSFDVDTCPHPQYFALLTLTYLQQPDPTRASYQPIAVYQNNFWSSNPLIRVVAGTTTFWLMTDLSRPERLFTFSSHSMSLAALVEVGFWDPTVVTEDSRIFLQCLVHYHGDYRVVPIFLTVSMHTVDVGTFWRSMLNQYRQIRRWAWSVENFPWMAQKFWRKGGSRIPLLQRVRYFWNLSEGLYSWVTAPILIFMASRVSLALAQAATPNGMVDIVGRQLQVMANLGLIGLAVFSLVAFFMLPQRAERHTTFRSAVVLLQWILMPFTLVVLGSIPALESQTRLMLGGRFRLGFDVTEKT